MAVTNRASEFESILSTSTICQLLGKGDGVGVPSPIPVSVVIMEVILYFW